MCKTTAACLYIALMAGPGVFAHAQPASTVDAGIYQSKLIVRPTAEPIGKPIARCSHRDSGPRALLPCRPRQADEIHIHVGSDFTRQQVECVLSSNCGATERGRVSG